MKTLTLSLSLLACSAPQAFATPAPTVSGGDAGGVIIAAAVLLALFQALGWGGGSLGGK